MQKMWIKEIESMYEKTGYCMTLFTLGYLSAKDIKLKKISAAPLLISGILAVIYIQTGKSVNIENFIVQMLPGMLFLLLALLTGEKIGYGDGAVLLVMGLWTSGFFCMIAACLAVFLSSLYSIYLLVKGKKELIPFVPFLLAAMEVMLLYE